MISLRWLEGCEPCYQTEYSSGADLRSREDLVIPALGKAKVATGVFIDSVLWQQVPQGAMPEIQIRARSGLAYKNGICLQNGVGTIDADYPDEICVLLWNSSNSDFAIKKGDRIAQMVLNLAYRLTNIKIGGQRVGGFGSTSV